MTALPGYEAGDWWVQDAAAAVAAQVLQVQSGERVLDMCAAPGEVQVEEALARHSNLSLDLEALNIPGAEPVWLKELGLRLRPDFWADRGGMDGFFIAALRKAA